MAITRNDSVVHGLVVVSIEIDNPPANVLDLNHCQQLCKLLAELRAENRARVVVLRGAGKRFSTGVDIAQHTPEHMPELLPAFHRVFFGLLALPAVTISAVHNHCLGGAAELAFACDRVIAEDSAKIAFPEIKVGCYPPVALALLPFRGGYGTAMDMVLSGDEVPVAELHRCGLVDVVAGAGGLGEAIDAQVRRYAGKSPDVIAMVANLMHERARRAWGDQIAELEKEYLDTLLPHPDATEGIAAFMEKRQPQWISAVAE